MTARECGVHETHLRLKSGGLEITRPFAARVFGQKPALASVDSVYNETAILESPELRLQFQLRGGNFDVQSIVLNRALMDQRFPQPGPPFAHWGMKPPLLAARVETGLDGGDVLTLSAPSEEFPGLTVERSVSLSGGLVRIDQRVYNHADFAQPVQLKISSNGWLGDWLIAPLADGILREPTSDWGEFPAGDTDLLAQGASLAESWIAQEGSHGEEARVVCALLWHPGLKQEFDWGGLPNLVADLGELPPRSVRQLDPIYIVGGNGDWRMARQSWKRLVRGFVADEAQEEIEPTLRRVLTIRSDPSPTLIFGDRTSARVAITNRAREETERDAYPERRYFRA